jgi:hypothetical protein
MFYPSYSSCGLQALHFVKSNKNDYVDAEAIAEAVQRPTM